MEAVQLISFNTAFVHQMHACTKPRPCGLLIPVCVDVQSALYSRDARVQPVPFLVTVSITALTLALGLAAGAVRKKPQIDSRVHSICRPVRAKRKLCPC